jgi:hypothetical protein
MVGFFYSFFLAFLLPMVITGMSPMGFRVRIARDVSSHIRITGELDHEGFQRTVSPWVLSTGCGHDRNHHDYYLNLVGESAATKPDRAFFDVSDMMMTMGQTSSILGLCIGFGSKLSETVESVLYIRDQYLVFNPVHPIPHQPVFYAPVMDNRGHLLATTSLNPPANHLPAKPGPLPMRDPLAVDVHESGVSLISDTVFAALVVHIRSLGFTVTSQGGNGGGYLVRGHDQQDVNCFSELVDRLPNLYFTFADPDNPQLPHIIFRIFGPRDYFVASNSDR